MNRDNYKLKPIDTNRSAPPTSSLSINTKLQLLKQPIRYSVILCTEPAWKAQKEVILLGAIHSRQCKAILTKAEKTRKPVKESKRDKREGYFV